MPRKLPAARPVEPWPLRRRYWPGRDTADQVEEAPFNDFQVRDPWGTSFCVFTDLAEQF